MLRASSRHVLRQRSDDKLGARLARSAATSEGAGPRTADVPAWLAERAMANEFRVEPIPFSRLDGWLFDGETGNLVHRTGRFFTVEGLRVGVTDRSGCESPRHWQQPILNQPEIAILGLLAKEFDGVPHILMQAKMEPGNCNLLQLSPTVQATWSNYTRVHAGAPVRYLEYFTETDSSRVLADVLQSEQGSWYDRKSNRNIIAETNGAVPEHDDFCWLTLGQIAELLTQDNVINMDARSALSCLPFDTGDSMAETSDAGLLSWFTGMRARYDVRAERIPLADVKDWETDDWSIHHRDGRYFRIIAASVDAGSREVTRWTQPLLEPCGVGIACFFSRRIGGVVHVLAQAKPEAGFLDAVEIAPTVQCTPSNYTHLPAEQRPRYLDRVLGAGPDAIRYSAVHSEEGGRFRSAQGRYLIIEAEDDLDPPPGYCWVTTAQLTWLIQHGHYLNMQARTLLACLNLLTMAKKKAM